MLTGGEAHDYPLAKRLIRRVNPPEHLLGDMAYDGDELREELERHRTKSVIPNRPNRRHPFSFSKRLYKLRWRIESAFNRLKDFRRIATRYDKLAQNYLASVCLAAALLGELIMDAKPDRRSQLGRSLFWLGTRIADIGLWAGAAALLAIVVLNAVNIVLRYFFKMPRCRGRKRRCSIS